MCTLGKLELLLKELERYNLKVTGLCETRWSGSGVFSREDHTVVYSGTEKGGRSRVAAILDKHHAQCLKSYNPISDHVLSLKLNARTTQSFTMIFKTPETVFQKGKFV